MARRLGHERGFTLIELLVVAVVVGLLAAIGIPQFLNHRERVWRSAVQSDLANVALQLEIAATDSGGSYPLAIPPTTISSPGVTIALGAAASTSRVCLKGDHGGLPDSIYYDSSAGGLTTVAC